jgi:hypothetical protein
VKVAILRESEVRPHAVNRDTDELRVEPLKLGNSSCRGPVDPSKPGSSLRIEGKDDRLRAELGRPPELALPSGEYRSHPGVDVEAVDLS